MSAASSAVRTGTAPPAGDPGLDPFLDLKDQQDGNPDRDDLETLSQAKRARMEECLHEWEVCKHELERHHRAHRD